MHDEGDEVKIAVCRLSTPQIMRIGLHHGKCAIASAVAIPIQHRNNGFKLMEQVGEVRMIGQPVLDRSGTNRL